MLAKHRKQVWASKGKTRVHRNINKCKREYNNVECSTQVLHVGQLSLPCIWRECINCIWTDSILEEELIAFTIRKSRKAIQWWNYKINEQVFARIILEGYSIQSYNAKSPPAETFKNSKAKDHLKALERRLESWISGDLLELLKEAETIQKSLRSKKTSTNIAEISKTFSQEMKKANFNSAMKILTDNMKNNILAFYS